MSTKKNKQKEKKVSAPGRKQGAVPSTRNKEIAADMMKAKMSIAPRIAGRSQQVIKYAEAITLPFEYPPERWASPFASQPTFVSNPFQRLDAAKFTAASPGTTELDSNQMVAFAFPSLARALVVYDPNVTAQYYAYDVLFTDIAAGSFAASPPVKVGRVLPFTPQAPGRWPLRSVYAEATQTYQPHGQRLYAMSATKSGSGSSRYFWLEKNTIVAVVYTFTGTAPSVRFSLDRWTADGVMQGALNGSTINVSGATSAVVVDRSAYYAIFSELLDVGAPAIGDWQVATATFESQAGASNHSVFCHLSIKDLENNVNSLSGVRFNALSLMYTNKAAELYKSGLTVGVQCPQGSDWTEFIGTGESSPYSQLSSINDAVAMEARNGIYGFLKPTKPSDFDFKSWIDCRGGSVVASYEDLDEDVAFLAIANAIPADNGGASQAGQWTICHGIEAGSLDVWRDTQHTSLDPQICDEALNLIRDLPQFYENPLHFADLVSKVKTAVKKYAPTILKGIKDYGPTALALAEGLLL